jgi:hypothetical protein
MASCTTDCVELACVPAAIAPDERPAHFALIRRLFADLVRERADLPNGYAYRFPPDAFDALARFVANERKCCPFLDFELELGANAGPIWLRLTGPAGTGAILEAELHNSGTAPPGEV